VSITSTILCAHLVLHSFPLVSQAKATADLLPAAQRGDVATVQDCLSKKANIETKDVRSVLACEAVSCILFDQHNAVFRRGRSFRGVPIAK